MIRKCLLCANEIKEDDEFGIHRLIGAPDLAMVHKKCVFIAREISELVKAESGIDAKEFKDGIRLVNRFLICPSCERWEEESCKSGLNNCIDKTYDFLQKNELYYHGSKKLWGNSYIEAWKYRKRRKVPDEK